MSFKVSDKRLLKKCITMLEKLSGLVGKEFDSELAHGDSDKYIKTKIKSYGDEINTNFQDKTVSKENTPGKCLSLIMLDSVIKVNKKYYSQTLSEQCKYEIRKNKMKNRVNDVLTQVHLMNLTMSLAVSLTVNLIIYLKIILRNLIMNLKILLRNLIMNVKILLRNLLRILKSF